MSVLAHITIFSGYNGFWKSLQQGFKTTVNWKLGIGKVEFKAFKNEDSKPINHSSPLSIRT